MLTRLSINLLILPIMATIISQVIGKSKYFKDDLQGFLKQNNVRFLTRDTKPQLEQKLLQYLNSCATTNVTIPQALVVAPEVEYVKKAIPKRLRVLVWDQTFGVDARNALCYCCRTNQISIESFECGHSIAEREGGLTVEDNLKPICSLCNRSMGTKSIEDFRTILARTIPSIRTQTSTIDDLSSRLRFMAIDTPCEVPTSIAEIWNRISSHHTKMYFDKMVSCDGSELAAANPALYERLRYIYFSLYYHDTLPKFFCFQTQTEILDLYKFHIRCLCMRLNTSRAIHYLNSIGIIEGDPIENIVSVVTGYTQYCKLHDKII
jgi:hypothetical protein